MFVFFPNNAVNLDHCCHFKVVTESGPDGGIFIEFRMTDGSCVRCPMETLQAGNVTMRILYNKVENGEEVAFITERPRQWQKEIQGGPEPTEIPPY